MRKDAAEAIIVSEMAHWNLARMVVSINDTVGLFISDAAYSGK
jgi:hypothetical protein